MIKNLIVFLFFIMSTLVHAQRSTFIFDPSLYGGLNLGLNNIAAEGAYKAYSPFASAGLAGGFYLGFNFSAIIGLKASADLQKFSYPEAGTNVNGLNFSGLGLSVDAMLNLSNLFSYYNLDRRTDFSIFAGVGALYCSPADDETLVLMQNKMMLPFRLGAQFDYKLNRSLDLNVNAMLNVLDDSFNEYEIGFRFDLVPKLTIGISHNF